jgi:hypothetical protein
MDMIKRFQSHAVGAAIWGLAVITAGCGSSGSSPSAPSSGFSSPTGVATSGFTAGTIEIEPAGAIVGTAVTLTSRQANDPAGNALFFAWDFGDGDTATGEAATHVYSTAGDFFPKVTVRSSEGDSAVATITVRAKSLTAEWSGDMNRAPGGPSPGGHGRLSITQDGLQLSGTYQDDLYQGRVAGAISATGTVTFTVTNPGMAPFTFTGTAGPDVGTLVGAASGRDVVNGRWALERN